MLILFLATLSVVTMAAQQRRGLRLATTLHERAQADEYGHGLERWAMRLLGEDGTGMDSVRDPWAAPLPTTVVEGGELRARIIDLAGRFNLNNLMPVAGGAPATARRKPDAHTPRMPPATAGSRRPEQAGEAPAPGDRGFSDFYDFIPPDWFVQEFLDRRAARHAGGASQPMAVGDPELADGYRRRFERLLRRLGLRPQLADAIQDWLDADVEARGPGGAEDDYYLGRSPAYRAANRPFDDVSELLLVRGVSRDVYLRLLPFVSVLPAVTPININTAPVEVLEALLPGMDEASMGRILERRRQRPFSSLAELQALLGERELDPSGLAVSSSYFRLQGEVRIGDYRQSCRARFLRLEPGNVVLLERGHGDDSP